MNTKQRLYDKWFTTQTYPSHDCEVFKAGVDAAVAEIDSAIGDLIALAASMARRDGMPSPYIDDWDFPKRVSMKAKKTVMQKICMADNQARIWAVQTRLCADKLKALIG